MGFGRGRSVDSRRSFDQDIQDAELERAEEEEVVGQGLLGFGLAMDKFNLEKGGNWASDYEALAEHVDNDAIESPAFWKKVFQEYKLSITAHGLFSSLQTELQRDPNIQEVFLSQDNFSLSQLPRTALENLGKDNVVDELLRDGRGFIMERVPWGFFSADEKREFVLSQIEINKGASMGLNALNGVRGQFADVVPDDEWRMILKEKLIGDYWGLIESVRGDLENLQKQFSNADLREMLMKTQDIEKPIYFSFDLSTLRKLEFAEGEIDLWKENCIKMTNIDAGFEGYSKMTLEDQKWTLQELPGRAASLDEGYREYMSNKLPKQLRRLPVGAVEKTMTSIRRLISDSFGDQEVQPEDMSEIVRSTLDAQGASGFRSLDFLSYRLHSPYGNGEEDINMVDHLLPNKDSIKVYKQVMSRTGARFQDFLAFYSDLRFFKDDEGRLLTAPEKSLMEEKLLLPYIDSGLPWVPEIFEDYERRVYERGDHDEIAAELLEEVRAKIDNIRLGELPEDEFDEETKALLVHVFPPALGVSREEYSVLIERRKNRQDDVPYEFEALQGREVSFSLGNWELEEGKEFSTKPWGRMSEVVSDINDKKIITETREDIKPDEFLLDQEKLVDIGREMVNLLKRSNSTKTIESLRDLYALYLSRGGAKLPDFVTGREEGARMTEWAKDALRDTIDTALKAYRETNAEKFDLEVLAATRRDVKPKARKSISGAITGMLRSANMSDHKKTERIKGILERVGISVEGDVLGTFRDLFENADSENPGVDIDNYVKELLQGSTGTGNQAGKLSPIIVSKILGGDADGMKHEMAKWDFIEGAEGGEERKLQFEITKKKLHAAAGMNMGVCVAVDDKLWNKREFMNVVLFADDGIARGGMHFEIVRDDSKTYLSLPGINPNMTALREVDAQKLTDAMLDFARDAARAMGAESVLIPTNPAIFSNREELHRIVTGKNMPVRSLSQSHRFSYSPFAYEWQDAYEIEV